MIITVLRGGLGNQMFEYAFGRKMALRDKTELKLSLSFLQASIGTGITPRENELYLFPNVAKAAPLLTEAEQRLIDNYINDKKYKAYNRLRKIFKLKPAFTRTEQYVDVFTWKPEALEAQGQYIVLDGLWQNENYFFDVAPIIRKDFSFPEQVSAKNKQLAMHIQACNAVSLHIRRGDYLTDTDALGSITTCSLDYYERAISIIEQKVTNPVFFIFSDEMKWVKENLNIRHEHILVEHNTGREAFEDMRLMSLCKHNIMANSTFSWWGAWLNGNPNKIVIAPAIWFAKIGVAGSHIVPDEWIKI